MKKQISIFLILSLLFLLSGCATIFKGETDVVSFTTKPAGATVSADGAEICSATPCQYPLKSNKEWNIQITKQGYKERTLLLRNKVGALWIILDILAGLVPLIIDAATGNWYQIENSQVSITLEKQ